MNARSCACALGLEAPDSGFMTCVTNRPGCVFVDGAAEMAYQGHPFPTALQPRIPIVDRTQPPADSVRSRRPSSRPGRQPRAWQAAGPDPPDATMGGQTAPPSL